MNALLAANLRAVKRSVRGGPEAMRLLAGWAGRHLQPPPAAPRPGTLTAVAPRVFTGAGPRHPIVVATPDDGHYLTTFFDVDPFSPSGRYLAVTRVPFINRIPLPGDVAHVCVVDLIERTCRVIHETRGWGAQLGANVQWGADDETLFCNDVVDGQATGVRLSRRGGREAVLGGPVFGLDPDRRFSYSGNIALINALIPGYGVPDPIVGRVRQRERRSGAEGIWRTDLATGGSELLVSLADLVPQLREQEEIGRGTYYVFNVKVNRQNSRLLAVLFSRDVPMRGGAPVQLVTMNIDGRNPRVALPDRLWRRGGHHPNWMPDGDTILMNLRHDGRTMAFVRLRYDGSALEVVAPGVKGSGHPSVNPAGTHLLTDAYVSEGFTGRDGAVPLRLVRLADGVESEIARIQTNRLTGPRRIDPHPVWSVDGRRIAFNGVVGGRRQVMIADMAGLA